MSEFYYLVKLHTTGKPVYLRVDKMTLRTSVGSRVSATRFQTRGVAQAVSEYFWMAHWDRLKGTLGLESRETVLVKKKGKRNGKT